MTKEKKRIAKTGVLFVVIIAITIWGINFIKSNDLLTTKTKLLGVYSDVSELTVGNHVYLSGTKIGKVVHVDFLNGDLNNLVVEFHIRNDIKIPDSSIAKITSIDLLGTKGIEIIINNKTKGHYKSGDTLITQVEVGLMETVNEQIMPLKNKTESMVVALDSLMLSFNSIFSSKTQKNLNLSFDHIQNTLKNLENSSVMLDGILVSGKNKIAIILKNVESITSNLENNNDNIEAILKNFKDISDTIAASNLANIISSADNSLAKFSDIMTKVEKGEGTLGLLLKDEELYNKLDKSANDLDKLLIDIKEHPKRYVSFSAINFGRKIIVADKDSIPE